MEEPDAPEGASDSIPELHMYRSAQDSHSDNDLPETGISRLGTLHFHRDDPNLDPITSHNWLRFYAHGACQVNLVKFSDHWGCIFKLRNG